MGRIVAQLCINDNKYSSWVGNQAKKALLS